MKQCLKGILIGFVMTVLLLGSVTVFAATTRIIEVNFDNYKTTLFGQEFIVRNDQNEILQPFSYNGSVFVPIEVILHAMDTHVSWDADTRTLNFGLESEASAGVSFASAVPPYDVSHRFTLDQGFRNWDVRVRNQVTMGGNFYDNAITFTTRGISDGVHSLHNLRGQYTMLSGYIGRLDGTTQSDGVFRFYGDGRLMKEFKMRAVDLPRPISLDVSGVWQLRIEFDAEGFSTSFTTYAFVGTIQ